ncbi:MAG: prenyltransferase [Caldisericia bacterium]|nr:prenyltransferase [Caldisericia bacterium]
MKNTFTKWMQIIRAQYLILCVTLSVIGNAVAWVNGSFQWSIAVLSLVGLLFAHSSVNIFNDYFDHKSGIDEKTDKSPFNGGSGAIQDEIITPRQTLIAGIITLFFAACIGVYFIIQTNWQLIPLLIVAGAIIVLYTPVLIKIKGGEWFSGIGLGALPVIGTYFVQTGHYNLLIILVSIPSLILVHNLLLVNEIPDAEADKEAGRKTIPIIFGKNAAEQYYTIMLITVYAYILESIILKIFPYYCLISFLTIPLAIKAKDQIKLPETQFRPVMQTNVLIVLLTQFLFGIGFILFGLIQ